MWQNTGMMRD